MTQLDFSSAPALLPTLNVAALLALLLIATIFDVRTKKIPNRLVVFGLGTSFLIHAATGLASLQAWGLGTLAGLALLLPLYLARSMGAGDVKLMAMVGSFLGPFAVLGVVLATLVAGGLLALAVALHNGALRRTWRNVQAVVFQTVSGWSRADLPCDVAPAASAGNLPYAVAIAVGTMGHLLLSRSGWALLD